MADQIVLLNHGRVDQIGTPRELYQRPATLFAADFIGAGNLIDIDIDAAGNLDAGWGKLTSSQWPEQCAGRIKLLLRPDVGVFDDHAGHQLNIVEKIFQGANHLYQLALPDGQTVACLAPSDIDQPIGDSLPVRFDLDQAVVFSGRA